MAVAGEGGGTPPTSVVIREPVLAAVAAEAACRVPGVVRLEAGVLGLVSGMVRGARERVCGRALADTDGVRVEVGEDGARIAVDLVVSGRDQAAAVAGAVRRTVGAAVTAATGVPVASVVVTILDVEPP